MSEEAASATDRATRAGQTVAIHYHPDGYDTTGPRLLGRQAAGEGFLKALVEHGSHPTLYCHTESRKFLDDMLRRIRPWSKRIRDVVWIQPGDARGLAQAGTFYRPDLVLEGYAWQRRFGSQRDFSICGVTHTIASRAAQDALGRLLIAPLQPWDALICTSRAVRTAVEHLHHSFAEYLRARVGAGACPSIKLPVIPLGVDTAQLASNASADARSALRAELGISPEDIAVLYVGRLISYAKAHPYPMYLALERVARQTRRKLHLIQAGWFEPGENAEQQFKLGASRLCPSVRSIFLDGRLPAVRSRVWSAADIFMSLSDNVQETFGITPIEAMASGLPVVVSDWDGYKESVRAGIDGFLIPTLTPPAGAGLDWAHAFGADAMNYSRFIANAAMVSSVDIASAADALQKLAENPDLRQRMGQEGRRRAREQYDWRVVIRAYEALWAELAEIRAHAIESAPLTSGAAPNPLCDDPFRQFGHYASEILSPQMVLEAAPGLPAEQREFLNADTLATFGAQHRAPPALIDQLLATLRAEGPLPVHELEARYPELPRPVLARTLVHLLKFDLGCRVQKLPPRERT
jgi:starch synthase